MDERALPSRVRGPVERGRGFPPRGSGDVGCSAGSESNVRPPSVESLEDARARREVKSETSY